jgi:hypothetical protein
MKSTGVLLGKEISWSSIGERNQQELERILSNNCKLIFLDVIISHCCRFLSSSLHHAALGEEGTCGGGEYGDDELDDGLPGVGLFVFAHSCKN